MFSFIFAAEGSDESALLPRNEWIPMKGVVIEMLLVF